MPRPRNTDGAIDDLGILLTAAYGLDISWMDRGSCSGWGNDRPGMPTPWQVAPGRRYGEFSGSELVKYALMVCFNCPAQYDCASYAIEGMMTAGTWSLPVGQLRWLQKERDGLDLVQMARDAEVPVQTVAAEVFMERAQQT